MKRRLNRILIAAFLASGIASFSCVTPEQQVQQHWDAYTTAMKHADITSAIVELNSIYSLDTSSQTTLDTMFRLYNAVGNYLSAYNVGNKIRDKQTLHKKYMAEASLKLGRVKEAKDWMVDIEETDTIGLSINSKFKLASMHFNDKEFPEALALLGKIVNNEASFEQQTRITGDSAVVQDVSYYAASHNFAGYVFLEMNDFESAMNHFNEALRVKPDFKLAQNNLAALEEKMKQ